LSALPHCHCLWNYIIAKDPIALVLKLKHAQLQHVMQTSFMHNIDKHMIYAIFPKSLYKGKSAVLFKDKLFY